jgi:hypothetical protein
MNSLKEDLSSYSHNSWSGWMEYLFLVSKRNKDGTYTIPKKFVDRWKGQMKTKYKDLPEDEKHSNILEANKIIRVIDCRNALWNIVDRIVENRHE